MNNDILAAGLARRIDGRRVNPVWRAPVQGYLANLPALYLIAVTVGVAASSLLAGTEGIDGVLSTYALAAVVFPLMLARRLLRSNMSSGTSPIPFQRALTPSEHFCQMALIAAGFLAVLWVALWLLLAVGSVAGGIPVRVFLATVAASAFRSACFLGVALGMSAWSRKNDTELLLLLLFLSVSQTALLETIQVPGWTPAVVEVLLLPMKGLHEIRQRLLGYDGTLEWWRAAHAVVYPSLWLAAGVWRMQVRDDRQLEEESPR